MSEEAASKCPVKHADSSYNGNSSNKDVPADSVAASTFWSRLLWNGSGVGPLSPSTTTAAVTTDTGVSSCDSASISTSSSCPVAGSTPASLEEAAQHAQIPQPDQKFPLATERQVSNIPRGNSMEAPLPHHQQLGQESAADTAETPKWVYPSEQQMYNAMRRKGWSNIPEESIPVVLQIHNGINERTWKQIQDWEGCTAATDLHLTRFLGRPRDLTPKAFFFSRILRLYDPPFDRHDWYVQRRGQKYEQRYVIDYYYLNSAADPNLPPIPFVDARPALDHPRALWLQSKRFLQSAFPGITAYWKRVQQQQQPPK